MANVFMMEQANLFCGDHDPTASNHLTLTDLKLPGLEENFADHSPGGAPMAVEFDTGMARLEANFNLQGWTPQVMTLIGHSQRQRQVFTAYGVIRDRRQGKALEAMAILHGRLGRVNPTNFRKGDLHGHEYSIRSIVHYELYMNGEEIFWWDFFTNARRIGGADLNFDINRILRIPVAV